MLRKLLKYDLRAVLKYWWIAAATTVGLSLAAGFLFHIVKAENTEYLALQVLSAVALFFCIFGILLLPLIAWVLVLIRLYKHFFTDEGYLTFTLPVKKHQLLNAKLLMTLIVHTLSLLVVVFDIFLAVFIGFAEEMFQYGFWDEMSRFFRLLAEAAGEIGGGYVALYSFEYLLCLLAATAASTLVIYLCITIAAVITRKHKVLVAIGLYYGFNFLSTGSMRLLMAEGSLYTLLARFSDMGEDTVKMSLALLGMIVVGICVLAAAGLYMLEIYLLERKLNLE